MLRLEPDGAELAPGAAVDLLPSLEAVLDGQPKAVAGVRLKGVPGLSELIGQDRPIARIVSAVRDKAAFPVLAILFDKSKEANWSLTWHQDRTIAVVERKEVPGFDPWTTKGGMQHVMPPAALLARMVTVRIHLDPVPAANGPLLIAPGSHRFGRIGEQDIASIVARCGVRECLADAGDMWLYSTLILHASDAARDPERRRVLQIDYAFEALPSGLRWLGV